jgi:hypothetical protein
VYHGQLGVGSLAGAAAMSDLKPTTVVLLAVLLLVLWKVQPEE